MDLAIAKRSTADPGMTKALSVRPRLPTHTAWMYTTTIAGCKSCFCLR